MLKIENKSKPVLFKLIYELLENRSYDASVMCPIQEFVTSGVCPGLELVNDMLSMEGVENENDAMELLVFTGLFGMELDERFSTHFSECIKKLEIDDFNENPYVKNINFDEKFNIGKKNVTLKMGNFESYEIFEGGFTTRNKSFFTKPNIQFFNQKVHYPALLQDDKVWMTITPAEISTMRYPIQKMKGNLVVFGLGLGYFTYMCALKDDVKSITIVELDQNIIDIFNDHIFTQFDDSIKDKINVIQGDAKDYFTNKEFMKDFDSCFVDIWRGACDGIELYGFFKENEKNIRLKPHYWIEDEFVLRFQDAMFFYILKTVVSKMEGAPPPSSIPTMENYTEYFLRKIENYFKKKKYVLTDKLSLMNLLFDRKIMNDVLRLKMID